MGGETITTSWTNDNIEPELVKTGYILFGKEVYYDKKLDIYHIDGTTIQVKGTIWRNGYPQNAYKSAIEKLEYDASRYIYDIPMPLSNSKITEAVAQNVLKWEKEKQGSWAWRWKGCTQEEFKIFPYLGHILHYTPNFDTNLNYAWHIVETMRTIENPHIDGYSPAQWFEMQMDRGIWRWDSERLATEICLTALRALGVDTKEFE